MKRIVLVSLVLIGLNINAFNQAQEKQSKSIKTNDISFDDILFWVGDGTSQAMFIVNWCNPEIAFAWGYRFKGDSMLVSDIIEDIAAADSRIHFTDGGGYITDITYTDSTYSLCLVGEYWMYTVNEGSVSGIGSQYVYNADFIEFGDESCGISDTNWIYTWNTSITPVSVPDSDVFVQSLTENNIQLFIYPNPCTDMINIDLKGVNEIVCLTITHIDGKILYMQNVFVSDSENISIPVNNLSKGVYFVRFQGAALNKTRKIIVY